MLPGYFVRSAKIGVTGSTAYSKEKIDYIIYLLFSFLTTVEPVTPHFAERAKYPGTEQRTAT